MSSRTRDLIVVGASAGGVEAPRAFALRWAVRADQAPPTATTGVALAGIVAEALR